MKALKIYEIDKKYLSYISTFSDHVFYSKTDKSNRKYIGVVLEIENIDYFTSGDPDRNLVPIH